MIKEIRKKLFWVSGDWSYSSKAFMTPYKEWLKENCTGNFTIEEKWHKIGDDDESYEFIGFSVFVENDEDALAFKLRWLD